MRGAKTKVLAHLAKEGRTAGAERRCDNGRSVYWLIRGRDVATGKRDFMYIADGKTEAEAWSKAAEKLLGGKP